MLHRKSLTSFTSICTLMMTRSKTTMTAGALSQPNTQPNVWASYKETLLEAGVLDLQKKRPIAIKAINIGSNAQDSMRATTDDGDENKDDDGVVTKIIHFQRHGQGYHNLLGDVTRASGQDIDIDNPDPSKNPFVRPEIQDSPLTHKGREEASGERMKASMLSPEVVIVSPLQRAVQTALLSFVDHRKNGIPFVAHEGCREQLGLLTCNKAMPLSQMVEDFPHVDFSQVSHGEEDTLWNKHPTIRELPLDEAERAYSFLTDFVMNRAEDEMAIVCHSAWLFSVCNAVIDCGGDESLESWFGTGEIRSLRVTFEKK